MFRPNSPGLFENEGAHNRETQRSIMGKNFSRTTHEDGYVPGSLLQRLLKKLKPLLHAKEATNKIHSQGYFENHYPEADSTLKEVAHQHVMSALSHARELAGDERSEGKSISINIHLGD